MSYDKSKPGDKENRWVPTICSVCHYMCGVRVHVIDGVAVGVEGIPESSWGARGGLCGKGASQLQILYDPNRLNYPVRRSNPQKGIGVDPKWQRISWDEATKEVVARLARIRSENPAKFGVTSGIRNSLGPLNFILVGMLTRAFGATFLATGAGLYCGNVTHGVAGLNHCSWYYTPDFIYGDYTIIFGDQKGIGGNSLAMLARCRGDAIGRGMKTVAFDPLCHNVAMSAKEWVPILPGTDLIVVLAMCNVLVNELNIYDREYLRLKTDAPYLVQPDGHFLRDNNGEPLMWDLSDGTARNWQQPVGDAALEGSYEVRGVKCRPVFAVLKEHLNQYSPERASEVSTVPAVTIRRIAAEFGDRARIGSTIEIQGVKLPYRPVSAGQFRSGVSHTNAFHTHMAVDLLNQLVGACDVPGGATAHGPAISLGYPGSGLPRYRPGVAKDGYVSAEISPGVREWPHLEPKQPNDQTLRELFPNISLIGPFNLMEGGYELLQKFGLDPGLEALLCVGGNLLKNFGSEESVAARLAKIPFVVCCDIYHNEMTEGFADMVLPMAGGLETLDFIPGTRAHTVGPYSMLDNVFHIRQPVVPPMYERRNVAELFAELFHKLGLTKEWNNLLNVHLCQFLSLPPIFSADGKDSWQEIGDRFLKSLFGPEHDLAWFKKHGFLKWPKRVEEAYWKWFVDGRVHIYAEWLIDDLKKIRAVCEPLGIKLDWGQYTPLISWFPPVIQEEKDAEYDLYCVTFTDSLHAGSWTHGIPWLAETSDTTPYLYTLLINTGTAHEKGIKEGDLVCVANKFGHKTSGMAHLIEGIHPQCVGTVYGTGKWAKGQPIARGKGLDTALLTQVDLKHLDPVAMHPEAAIVVKIFKAGAQARDGIRANP